MRFAALTLLFVLSIKSPLVSANGQNNACDADRHSDDNLCSKTARASPGDDREISEQSSWLSGIVTKVTKQMNDIKERLITPVAQRDEMLITPVDPMDDLIKQIKELGVSNDIDVGHFLDVFGNDGIKDAPKNEDAYLYPPLSRRHPGKAGDVREVELVDGVKTKMFTKSTNPPLFEIPNFLTDEECDFMVEKSSKTNLKASKTFRDESKTYAGENLSVHRVSQSTYLNETHLGKEFIKRIYEKVARLVDMPVEVVTWSEMITIGKYTHGGHYNAHLDSNEALRKVPCCFQTKCLTTEGRDMENNECCRVCRYATVLYYLNDVEEGGETAFPLADYSFKQLLNLEENWSDLNKHCHHASVTIKPEKGKAIMWYNHFVDSKGYLGAVDKRSYHGGCNVVKGTKWIATNWISTPIYPHRYVSSKRRNIVD